MSASSLASGVFGFFRRILWRERPWGGWWRAVRHWNKGYCFPADGIFTQHWITLEAWDRLFSTRNPEDRAEEKKIKEWMRLVVPRYTMLTYGGLSSLIDQVRYCEENKIPGAYVETGCNRGGSTAMMAKACLHYGGKPRAVHAFDSFEGLPQPDREKDTDAWIEKDWKIPAGEHDGEMKSTGSMLAGEEDVREAFRLVGYPESHLFLHKGWFCDTVPPFAATGEEIAILRLDGDLYASTYEVLVHLYPRVVAGGFVVIDDYYITGARRALEDYMATQPKPVYISKVDGCVAYFVKPGV